jgi:hypothetical protein
VRPFCDGWAKVYYRRKRKKRKEMIRNAAEETDRGVADILPSWGAAMLRPYMIVPRRENGMHCGDLARRRRRRDLP